ncbi:hypothetical protein CERSUDRAFT_124358 [Gelatoporia subvermispora B]|uniref:DUF6535 domain-containing protein n=1 Tax=Ceriporiopsis subvermispora (strain B) TaxID=914234 RepID=M2PK21_CERS8|nr:hypothetical protein CERSUDRAFT_124358 [Gelatoporia subvermispora B]
MRPNHVVVEMVDRSLSSSEKANSPLQGPGVSSPPSKEPKPTKSPIGEKPEKSPSQPRSEPPISGGRVFCGCGSGSDQCACFLKTERIRSDGDTRKAAVQAAEDGWAACDSRLRTHDEAMTRAWKEEIDTSLIFAGLFSAVLTAFNVQVYPSLQTSSAPDLQTQVLIHLSAQLSAQSSHDSPFRPVLASSSASAGPSNSMICVNALWFASLVVSLAAASLGIVIRQWLNHFVNATSPSPRRSVYIHCFRWDLGLVAWHVPTMLSLLPVLLQVAVALFLAGLCILLSTLNYIVSTVTIALVSTLFAFLFATTVIPFWAPSCPYRSPQALLACRALQWLYKQLLELTWPGTYGVISRVITLIYPRFPITSTYLWRRLSRLSVYQRTFTDWTTTEKVIVDAEGLEKVAANDPHLKTMKWVRANALERTWSLLMDDALLENAIAPCIMDPRVDGSLTLSRLKAFTRRRATLPSTARTVIGESALSLSSYIQEEHFDKIVSLCIEYYVEEAELPKNAIIGLTNLACRCSQVRGSINDDLLRTLLHRDISDVLLGAVKDDGERMLQSRILMDHKCLRSILSSVAALIRNQTLYRTRPRYPRRVLSIISQVTQLSMSS